MSLPKLIHVDEEKCVNCHACIAACPVKFCNEAKEKHVEVNHDLCIGCGCCLKACTHEARNGIDDFEAFMHDIKHGVKMVSIVAPAVASNFPGQYLNLNGWLKSLGVAANFDVSFGAELTIKSYLTHVTENKPKCVIAQPCPAIVSFIEIYHPELLPFLAPADSPMLHIMKMVREFHPEYAHHKLAVISPCFAKKREFVETGFGDYNVTMQAIRNYIDNNRINLNQFEQIDYDNPPAERAVLFSTPGGLLETAKREVPTVGNITRKIEGPHIIYDYLASLKKSIDSNDAPVLIDCLNCDEGCNGGTGTAHNKFTQDQLEAIVSRRSEELKAMHAPKNFIQSYIGKRNLKKSINAHWKPGLYARSYLNLASTNGVKKPDQRTIDSIYKTMEKSEKKDIANCQACGYKTCEEMATAIHNGLNKKENCYIYNQKLLEKGSNEINEMTMQMEEQRVGLAESIFKKISKLQEILTSQDETGTGLQDAIINSSEVINEFGPIAKAIEDISFNTNIIALNASIEAAHVEGINTGFSSVALEVKNLANRSREEAQKFGPHIQKLDNIFTLLQQRSKLSLEQANEAKKLLTVIYEEVNSIAKGAA